MGENDMKITMFKKMIVIILLSIIMYGFVIMPSYAMFSKENVKSWANTTASNSAVTSTQNIVGGVIAALRIVCMGVAITMLLVLAMKYMSAAPSEKADIKKHAVVYVVGAVVMFAASGLLTIIGNFASSIGG
jgi:long-subunit acyl-CoA synthetase (AMP-forming)